MDGREGIALSGSVSYYFHRGVSDHGTGPGSGALAGSGMQAGFLTPSGFKPLSNPSNTISVQSNMRSSPMGSTFQMEYPSPPNFPHGISKAVTSSASPGDSVKKKRGRPRKYGPGGANMSLGLSPMSATTSPGSMAPTPKRNKGRPPGSGRKQRLASLGEWMNSSAGLAFTPHIIRISIGEDVAEKILSFAQHRPRALCVLSANGAVSAITLHQPASSSSLFTFEGRFEILCLSGSYLLSESGGPRSRTGGLSISVCSPDGHVIGGAVGGRLVAASPVQVVVCSFVFGCTKTTKPETSPRDFKSSAFQPTEKSTHSIVFPDQNFSSNPTSSAWPPASRPDLSNTHSEIDLARG